MTGIQVFIRLDLPNGNRIGPGKIAQLEAIRAKGSITAAARHLGMAYRTAWLLVQEINNTLQQPAVTTTQGGPNGSGAAVIPVGEKVIEILPLDRRDDVCLGAPGIQAIAGLVRRETTPSIATQQRNQLSLEEGNVKAGIVRHERRIADER